ncbi:MAG: hypothetical protein V5783_08615 [Pontiella sp.]
MRSPILWGAYLACSWTWCIGMFLPALLLRDMGWAGFLIFAIPNVIGASAMGWMIKTKSGSIQFVERHASAIWWFSAITIAFHLYWILWLATFIPAALGIPARYLAGCIAFVGIFAVICSRTIRIGKAPQTAIVLLVLSLCVLMGATFSSDLLESNQSLLESVPLSAAPLWMLPVMIFGFLLCPYLDITFHYARQQLDSAKKSRLGFTIGFVGFFSFMLLLTTRYAGVLSGAMDGVQFSPINPWLASGILIHILCQWFFTVSVHLNRIRTIPGAESKKILLVAILIAAGVFGFFAPGLPTYAGLLSGEVGYRLFMSAYGLIFPAYMLYRVMVRRKKTMAGLYIMWMAIALASPFLWMGFVERQPIWLLPGMALILCGALIPPKKRSS